MNLSQERAERPTALDAGRPGPAMLDGQDDGLDGLDAGASSTGRPVPAGLTPFVKGDGRAAAAARKGNANRAARRGLDRRTVGDAAAVGRHVAATWSRRDVGPLAVGVACDLLARVAAGEVRARHVGDVAELLRVCVDVARLEAGEATSSSIVAHVGTREAVAELRARARAIVASSVADVTVEDDQAGALEAGPAGLEQAGALEAGEG